MSNKWADYCISAKRMNSKGTIEKLQVHEDTGSKLSSPTTQTKKQVISALKNGYSFVTVRKNGSSEWVKGEDVRHVKDDDNEDGGYIRTDRNSIKSDNLGNLPDF